MKIHNKYNRNGWDKSKHITKTVHLELTK